MCFILYVLIKEKLLESKWVIHDYLTSIVRFWLKNAAIVWNVTLVSGDLIIALNCVWNKTHLPVE